MKYKHDLGKEHFDALLALFSTDPAEAGEKYEQIRTGLVRYFRFNGCAEADELADETIDRVACRADMFDARRSVDPTVYFYGFAANILKEYRRGSINTSEITDRQPAPEAGDTDEPEAACLDRCLDELSTDEKELIVEYFSRERQEKIEVRRRMCERLNCTSSALYVRVYRIKIALKTCIERCIDREM